MNMIKKEKFFFLRLYNKGLNITLIHTFCLYIFCSILYFISFAIKKQ